MKCFLLGLVFVIWGGVVVVVEIGDDGLYKMFWMCDIFKDLCEDL